MISKEIDSKIREVLDFPKKGISFKDITPLLMDKNLSDKIILEFKSRVMDFDIDAVIGIESRGFLYGFLLANKLGVPFIPIRKKGKLPADTVGIDYELEYGTDRLEIHTDSVSSAEKVLLVDDLIATGGTAVAAAKLIEQVGGIVTECAFIVDLPDLGGSQKLASLKYKSFSLCEFEGE